jgi:hypothetical protein
MVGSEHGFASSCAGYIMLAGGLALPVQAVQLALELEERGFQMSREGAYTLVVKPHEYLTDNDCLRIRRWKWHLLALLDYGESQLVQ